MNENKTWAERNPERIAMHKKKYYEKNLEQAKRRSKIQNLKGKLAWKYLSESQRFLVMSEIKEEIGALNTGGSYEQENI
jgi:hypothetical protein